MRSEKWCALCFLDSKKKDPFGHFCNIWGRERQPSLIISISHIFILHIISTHIKRSQINSAICTLAFSAFSLFHSSDVFCVWHGWGKLCCLTGTLYLTFLSLLASQPPAWKPWPVTSSLTKLLSGSKDPCEYNVPFLKRQQVQFLTVFSNVEDILHTTVPMLPITTLISIGYELKDCWQLLCLFVDIRQHWSQAGFLQMCHEHETHRCSAPLVLSRPTNSCNKR